MNFKQRIAAKKSALTPAASTLAAAALTSISQQAESALVCFDVNVTFGPIEYMNFDPLTGVASDGLFGDTVLQLENCGDSFSGYGATSAFWTDSFIPAGSLLGSSSNFSTYYADFANNSLPVDTSFYAGFKIDGQGVSGTDTYYGWVEFTFNPDQSTNIIKIAYEDQAFQTVSVGAVPEPSVPLFGAAAFILTVSFRKRR
ncbi:MAG: hypothetical protein AAGC74_14690 [Verrucomicrobiota bacterium]